MRKIENINDYIYVNGVKTKKTEKHKFKIGEIDKNTLPLREDFELTLCREDNSEIQILEEAVEVNITPRFQETYELNFKIPEHIPSQYKLEKNDMYSYIEEGLLVKFNEEHMFKIVSTDIVEKDINYKSVHCFSREHELTKVHLKNFHGTRQLYVDGSETSIDYCEYSLDGETYQKYITPITAKEGQTIYIKLYDTNGTFIHEYTWNSKMKLPEFDGIVVSYRVKDSFKKQIEVDIRLVSETGEGILNMLEEETGWRVDYLDPLVREDFSWGQFHRKYRTFSIDEKNWLEFLREDICKTFQGIIIFDTINRKISMYHIDNYTEDRGLFISRENYAKHLEKKADGDEVTTVLYCYGKDNKNIVDINPTGQEYIFNFSHYKNSKFMSENLIKSLDNYEKLIEDKTPIFYDYLQKVDEYSKKSISLENELVDLEVQWDLAQDIIDLEIQNYKYSSVKPTIVENTGDMNVEVDEEIKFDTTDAEVAKDLTPFNKRRDEVEKLIKDKKVEIENNDSLLKDYFDKITSLKQELKINNNFSKEEIRELSGFIKVNTFVDESLYRSEDIIEEGRKKLKEISKVKVSFSLDMVDIFNVIECQHDWNKLNLGDLIHVYSQSLDEESVVRVVEINHQIDKGQLSIVVSNKDYLENDAKFITDLMSNSNNVSNTFDKYKPQFHTIDKNADLVTQLFEREINTAYNRLVSARNQNVRIDERGILMKDMFEDNEQLRIVNNVIAMTKDGLTTAPLYGNI